MNFLEQEILNKSTHELTSLMCPILSHLSAYLWTACANHTHGITPSFLARTRSRHTHTYANKENKDKQPERLNEVLKATRRHERNDSTPDKNEADDVEPDLH